MYDLNIFLNLAYKNFVENFCMDVQRNWSVLSFAVCPYPLLISKYLPFIDLVVSLLFCGSNSSESLWSWAFLWGANFDYSFNLTDGHKGEKENHSRHL